MLIEQRKFTAEHFRSELPKQEDQLGAWSGVTTPPPALRLVSSVWNFYGTLVSLRVDVSSVSPQRFPTAAPLYPSQAPSCVSDKNTEARNLYQAQVCAPLCGSRSPEGRTRSGALTPAVITRACVFRCVQSRHAPTADLWLANGNKVLTKMISVSGAEDTPRKPKERKRSECASGSNVFGGPLLQEKRAGSALCRRPRTPARVSLNPGPFTPKHFQYPHQFSAEMWRLKLGSQRPHRRDAIMTRT